MKNKSKKILTAFHFEVFGSQVIGNFQGKVKQKDSFHANFGVSPNVCKKIFNSIIASFDNDSFNPKWLLLTLFFLKVYPTSRVLATLSSRDRSTVMSHIWEVIELIAGLKKKVVS